MGGRNGFFLESCNRKPFLERFLKPSPKPFHSNHSQKVLPTPRTPQVPANHSPTTVTVFTTVFTITFTIKFTNVFLEHCSAVKPFSARHIQNNETSFQKVYNINRVTLISTALYFAITVITMTGPGHGVVRNCRKPIYIFRWSRREKLSFQYFLSHSTPSTGRQFSSNMWITISSDFFYE